MPVMNSASRRLGAPAPAIGTPAIGASVNGFSNTTTTAREPRRRDRPQDHEPTRGYGWNDEPGFVGPPEPAPTYGGPSRPQPGPSPNPRPAPPPPPPPTPRGLAPDFLQDVISRIFAPRSGAQGFLNGLTEF